ncbi:MAG: hypothetical protein ACTH0B_05960, partial [Senegalia sp. (in: firmicutes)]
MKNVISVSIGEAALKKGKRNFFENKLLGKIRIATKDLGNPKVYRELGKIYIEVNEDNIERIINRVKKVFGLVYLAPAYRIEKNIDDIRKMALEALEDERRNRDIKSFRIV